MRILAKSKILKASALAVSLTGLTGCIEPQHPVYGFTQLDLGLSLMIILLVAIAGTWIWSVWDLINFRKNLTTESYKGELFQWQNTKIGVPGVHNGNDEQ